MNRYDWIIGICNTATDGVQIFRFRGTISEVKEKLISLIKTDRSKDEEIWKYGCENVDDIRAEANELGYELYGYGCYMEYHIDYTAKEFAHVEFLK